MDRPSGSEKGMTDEPQKKIPPLTNKQRVFIDEYLKCWNAAEACRRAGYSVRTAASMGRENMTKPAILQEIKTRLTEYHMGADEALALLAEQARAKITDVIDDDGEIDWQKVMKHGYIVKAIRPNRWGTAIELVDSQGALDKIMRVHGKYKDAIDLTSAGEKLEIVFREVKQENNDPDADH